MDFSRINRTSPSVIHTGKATQSASFEEERRDELINKQCVRDRPDQSSSSQMLQQNNKDLH